MSNRGPRAASPLAEDAAATGDAATGDEVAADGASGVNGTRVNGTHPAAEPAEPEAAAEPEADPEAGAEPEAAATPARPASRQKLSAWLSRGLLLVVLAATAYTLISQRHDITRTMHKVPWESLVVSEFMLLVGIFLTTLAWRTVANDLGAPIGVFRSSQIVLVGQLGKYLPGSLWAYVLQMELGRKAGLARPRIFAASLIHVGVSIVASLMLGVLALPLVLKHSPEAAWLFLLLPFGLIALWPKFLTWAASRALRTLKRQPLPHPLRWRAILITLAFALASYACFGVHLWLLANSQGSPGVHGLVVCTGALAIGLTAGIFAFILPSGVGVREAVIVAALSTSMSTSNALAFAVASRIMFTVADVATAGAAALAARLRDG